MSNISIFTSVKYNNNLENPTLTERYVQHLDNWTFPLFGSKIEVININIDNATGRKIAQYHESTARSTILETCLHIVLLATVIFPVIVLIARAVVRRNVDFRKVERQPNPVNIPLQTRPEDNIPIQARDEGSIQLQARDARREIRVAVGRSFSIELWHSGSTGHDGWQVSQLPPFITPLNQFVNVQNHSPGFVGGGHGYGFVFEPNGPGRGEIVMRNPCSFDATRTGELPFTIIAE